MRRWRPAFLGEFMSSLRSFDWSELRYASACGYWPLAVYIVICAGSVLLVLIIAGLLLMPAQISSWQRALATSSALNDEHTALLEQVATNSARNLSIASRCGQCPNLRKHLRSAASMPVVVDRLKDAAATRGITISALRPQRLWRRHPVHAYEIDVQLQADKQQLIALLDDIKSMGFALAIKQLDWHLVSSQVQMILLLRVGSEYASRGSTDVGAMTSARATAGDTDITEARQQQDSGGDWQRVAYIQRGNRYLEVQRDAQGDMRRRIGELTERRQ